MIFEYTATITCDGSGDATVYLGSNIRGRLIAIKYTPGTIDTNADLTFTGATTSQPILTKSNAGTSVAWYYPRILANKVADGSAFTDTTDDVWIFQERVKLVVAQGGAAGAGSVKIWVDEDQ